MYSRQAGELQRAEGDAKSTYVPPFQVLGEDQAGMFFTAGDLGNARRANLVWHKNSAILGLPDIDVKKDL